MNLLYLLQVILGFGFVIFIHEMGHFLAAKKVGIRVHAFSIGFPMPFVGKRFANIFRYKRGDTEYRLGWIPFGGYVQMEGQSDSPNKLDGAKENDSGDYRNKSYAQKTLVLLGGVAMNAVTAVLFFILAFQLGVTFIEPTIGAVEPKSKAWVQNEVKVGDRIVGVNGREVVDFEDVVYAGIFDGGDNIRLEIERQEGGRTVRKTVDVPLDEDSRFGILLPGIKARHKVILLEEEASRFPESLGDDRPQEGDEIIAVDGREIRNSQDALGLIGVSRGEIELTLKRGNGDDARQWDVKYTPRRHFSSGSVSGYIAGIGFIPSPWVGSIQKNGAGDRAGMKPGDHIVGMRDQGGQLVGFTAFAQLTNAVDASQGKPIVLVVERDGRRVDLVVTPDPRESQPGRYELAVTVSPVAPDAADPEDEEGDGEDVVAYRVRPGSEAEKAGMLSGDRIVAAKVSGTDFSNPETGRFDMGALGLVLDAAWDKETGEAREIVFSVQREDGLHEIALTPDVNDEDSVAMMSLAAAELRSEPVTYGLGKAVVQGLYHSRKVAYKILMTLGGLFSGRISVTHLGGPIVIAKRSYSLAGWGVGTLIFFLAFISLNLAIVNLIPLPILDGGQWLIVTIEKIAGRAIPEKVMHVVGTVSFFLVIGLMLFVLGNDLVTVFWRKWV